MPARTGLNQLCPWHAAARRLRWHLHCVISTWQTLSLPRSAGPKLPRFCLILQDRHQSACPNAVAQSS